MPQPSVLKDTSSSTEVHNGLVLLGRGELSDFGPATIEEMMNHFWVVEEGITSVDQLKARLLERSPDCIEKARHAIQVYEETGHTSWYGWQLANWGVKWGAYNAKPEEWADGSLSLTFDTAWSVPHPIFEKIAAEFPAASGEIASLEEFWSFACLASFGNGRYLAEEVEPTDAFYERVFGHAPEHGD
ncbi:hypothetical protein EN873_04855 [bacterium M00.F.Ca.ET.230.01.1.1]|nr:hypothetical protein EN873_04855 [bacterium M00.F.Ca.ET.230.01.1.1]